MKKIVCISLLSIFLLSSANIFSQKATQNFSRWGAGQNQYRGRGYVDLTYAELYSNDTVSLLEIPNLTVSGNMIGERGYFRMMSLDLLLDRNMKFADVLFGMGFGIAPFKKILHFNLDASLSYGMAGWNNCSGLVKPYAMLRLPIGRSKNGESGIDLTFAVGYYYKYSYRLLGYLGSDLFYKDCKGYFIQGGLSVAITSKQ